MSTLDHSKSPKQRREEDAIAVAALADFLRASDSVAAGRLAICEKCPKHKAGACEALQCKPAPILMKTHKQASRCELQRWGAELDDEATVRRWRVKRAAQWKTSGPPAQGDTSSPPIPSPPPTQSLTLRGMGTRIGIPVQTAPRRHKPAKGIERDPNKQ